MVRVRSANLAKDMDAAVEVGKMQNWTRKEFREALRAIILAERKLLKSGKRKLNKNARPGAS